MPPDYAAEMVPFDPLVGEFRVHYAGFFDPGFGYAGAGGRGARAVLEVRSREVPFILEHGQTVGRLVYEHMLARPKSLYGQGIGSNYQAQGLKLSKHFRDLDAARAITMPCVTSAVKSLPAHVAVGDSRTRRKQRTIDHVTRRRLSRNDARHLPAGGGRTAAGLCCTTNPVWQLPDAEHSLQACWR